MPNILHISKFYPPFKGGIELVAARLCEGAVEKGHQVRVYCSSHSSSSYELDKQEMINGVEVFRGKTYGHVASQPLTLGLFTQLKPHLKWADVVYLHTPNPLAECATRLLLSDETPLVIVHHSDIINQKFLKRLYSPIQLWAYNRADSLIAFSENHIRYSSILPKLEDRCHIIPFGIKPINNNIQNSIAEEIKRKYGDFALFIGRLVEYKGVEKLIDAAQSFRGNILVIGDGPLRKTLEQRRDDLSLTEKVIFVGRIEDDLEFQSYIQASSFFVLPSISPAENYGIVQLEVMAHKKPIIASNLNSGASTIVEDGETGILVPPGDVKNLAHSMNKLLENPFLREKLGRAGYQRYLNYYTWEQMIESHDQLVNRLDTSEEESLISKKAG